MLEQLGLKASGISLVALVFACLTVGAYRDAQGTATVVFTFLTVVALVWAFLTWEAYGECKRSIARHPAGKAL